MNDCLFLPFRQRPGGERALSGWECAWCTLGEGEERRLFDGGGRWRPVQVPGQQVAVEGRQAIWYRTTFARPDHAGRVLLRFGGAFLAANVWLNGRLLGSHYGYFGPFGFDVTPGLKADNLLVVCCETPIETDLSRKRHLTGAFGDGDSRPYPGTTYFSLPERFRWEMPLGLWRQVELEYVGPLILDWVRLSPRLDAGDVGRLEVEVRLRNLDAREMPGELAFEVRPPDGPPLRLRREVVLPGGLERTLSFSLSIPQPRLWWPWRLGEATTYGVRVEAQVDGEPTVALEDRCGFRDLAVRAAPEGWSVTINGNPFFLRGANYMPDLRLDQLTPERFAADLALAREANLDALRVHGHVLPTDFYHRADEAGMLAVADFPLTLAYAYHSPDEEVAFFENAVRELVPEMVEMLRNRPSVAWWVVHDDPAWIAANAHLGDVHAVRQNYSIDQEARSLVSRLDPGRLALAGSGDLDTEMLAGWSGPGWQEFSALETGMLSKFGAQSLPTAGSPVWSELTRPPSWPPAEAEPDWLYRGYQPVAWAEHGPGPPSEHRSLEAMIESSQRYQAWVVRFGAEQMRKRKFEPCWGAFVHEFVDPFPAIGFSMLDHSRVPKLALDALKTAFAPTRLILDPVGYEVDPPGGVRFRPGRPVLVRLVVVNDDPGLSGPARVRWSVAPTPASRGARPLTDLVRSLRRGTFSGWVDLDLPEWSEPAVQVASLNLPLDTRPVWRLEGELFSDRRLIDRCHLDIRVGPPRTTPRSSRPMPAFLSERLVVPSSLRRVGSGLGFTLLNRTRPAVLGSLDDFQLDGARLLGIGAQLEGGLPLPRRLDFGVGREVAMVVEPRHPVPPGRHRLEFHLEVPGVASGVVWVEGEVA